jgi:DNA-binding MarR family transcriptional regulator
MQVDSRSGIAGMVARLVLKELPGRRGLDAWQTLLRAHATLMRMLDQDLQKKTGLALADFDVLAQLAAAGGELRMTELADRALISRSGMTRRVARLVEDGLVLRAHTAADARGVVVALTDAGVARVVETTPVHARAVFDVFVSRLEDKELAVLESALDKVTLDCTFG